MAEGEFTEKEKPTKNLMPVGRSGTLVTADTIVNDHIKSLIGEFGQEEYAKMLLSDSQIRKLYHAVSNPIRSATWDIEPASDDPLHIKQAALMKQIIFHDIVGGWKAKLDEILTFPWHGHVVFEKIHDNVSSTKFGNYTTLRGLGFRDQRTLDRWRYTPLGELEKIHQLQQGDIEVNDWMQAKNLFIIYNEKKGNDTGYPFCRMLYGNYKRKLLYKQLQAIGIEKGAIGVPILNLPESVDYQSDEYQAASDQLAAYTQAENAYIILPNGYELNLDQSNTFDPSKVQVAIKAENEEISGSLVAMWLEMGIGGNSAVGSSTGISADFFKDGIEYLADKISEGFNNEIIPEMMIMNYGNSDECPRLVHAGIADEAGEELMKVVTGYTKANVITADEPLEDHIRKAHNLPKKAEGEVIDNGGLQTEENQPTEEEVELSTKKKIKTPKDLIVAQADKISEDITEAIEFASAKYINDTMNRYRQLSVNKKQNATDKIKIAGTANLKKDLRRRLTDTANRAIEMARKEVPSKRDIELNNHERDMVRLVDKYGWEDINEIKLNDFSKLPAYIQVLVSKQSDLISTDSMNELKKRLDFSYSGIELKSADENVIRQAMEEEAENFATSNQVKIKGTNVASLMVNEGRDSFFFEPDVLEEIHSFTFVNIAPVSAVCKELAGTTFNTNDAESLRYTPPLHHNCKSYLRANLKTSKGIDRLEVSTLSPSATAKKSITL